MSFKGFDFIHINSCYHKFFVFRKGWDWFKYKYKNLFWKAVPQNGWKEGLNKLSFRSTLKQIFKIFPQYSKKKNQWNDLKITWFPGILLQFRGIKKIKHCLSIHFVHKIYVCDTMPMMKKQLFKKMHVCRENSPSLLLFLPLACIF